MKVVYSERYLEHDTGPGHPERKERLLAIVDYLKRIKAPVKFVKPRKIDEEELLIIHDRKLIEDIKERSRLELGGGDNPFRKNTFKIALMAAGGGLRAAEIGDEEGFAFGLIRPPGHHAGRDFFEGFCYFNNVAFALKKIQKGRRAMIIDIDVHHCNGTQDIFRNDESVFCLMFHQDPATIYPFRTGYESENNDHMWNVPLPLGIGDEGYIRIFEKKLKEALNKFQPELVGISAGFDTYYADNVYVGSRLDIRNPKTYERIGKMMAIIDSPKFGVLEGGYSIPDLAVNLWNFLKPFSEEF